MFLRPWLLRYRSRLILAAIASLAGVLFVFYWTSAENLTDYGVFWHHFCGCPPDPDDTGILMGNVIFLCFAIGLILGFPNGSTASAAASGRGEVSFLLTRPVVRQAVLLCPVAIAVIAMVLFPGMAYLLLFGWLHLVHAPSLGHVLALIELLPSASGLGPHPSLGAVLGAIDLPRRYLAAISVGLCGYALMVCQRWLILSPNKWVKLTGVVSSSSVVLLCQPFFGKRLGTGLLLTSRRGATLTYLPSTLGIALHFAFFAAVLYACWRVLRSAEV
jgi:hypothetical protein